MQWSTRSCRWRWVGVVLVASSLATGCTLFKDYSVEPRDTDHEPRDTVADTRADISDGGDADAPTDTAPPQDTRDGDTRDTTDAVAADTRDTREVADGEGDGGDTSDTTQTPDADGSTAPDNKLINPGFESGSQGTGCPVAWTCVTYSPRDAGEFSGKASAYKGQYAASWSGDGSPDVAIKQSHPATPGQTYEISVWVKSDGLSNPPFVEILFDDEQGEVLRSETIRPDASTDTWTQITGTTGAAPSGTASMRYNMSIQETGGTVWWDEASLTE